MRIFYLVLGLILLGGICASILLVTSQREMAHMLFRDKQYEQSKKLFEQQIKSGKVNAQTVLKLVSTSLATGDVEKGLKILEGLLEEDSPDPRIVALLIPIYRATLDLPALDKMLELSGSSSKSLRERAWIARLEGNAEKEAIPIQMLANTYSATSAELERLSLLYLRAGKAREGGEALEQLGHQFPEKYSARSLLLHFEAIRQGNQSSADALAEKAAWFLGLPGKGQQAPIVLWELLELKEDQAALALFTQIKVRDKFKPAVLDALVSASLNLHREDTAYQVLKAGFEAGVLDEHGKQLLFSFAERAPDGPAFMIEAGRKGVLKLSNEKKKQLAYASLQKPGGQRLAEEIFKELAQQAEPNSPEVKMLLHLWGPRPGAEAIAWLESRADQSSGPSRKIWLGYLYQFDENKRPQASDSNAGQVPDKERNHLSAGLRNYEQNNRKQAEEHLELFFGNNNTKAAGYPPGDVARAYYYLGEIYRGKGDEKASFTSYQQGLAFLESDQGNDANSGSIKASLLEKVRGRKAAIDYLMARSRGKLLTSQEKVQLSDLLIAEGRTSEARAVLGE